MELPGHGKSELNMLQPLISDYQRQPGRDGRDVEVMKGIILMLLYTYIQYLSCTYCIIHIYVPSTFIESDLKEYVANV